MALDKGATGARDWCISAWHRTTATDTAKLNVTSYARLGSVGAGARKNGVKQDHFKHAQTTVGGGTLS